MSINATVDGTTYSGVQTISVGGKSIALAESGSGGDVVRASWHQCPEVVREYLANVDYTDVPYTQTSIETYAPNPAVPATNSKPNGETIDGVTYYNTVPNVDTPFASTNAAGTLNPLDHVRWIKSVTNNMRDIGGWACDGGTIRYGRIFRSGSLHAQDEDLIVNQLGIQTEYDLEGDGIPAYSGYKMRYFEGTGVYYSLVNRDAWRTNLRGAFDAVRYGGSAIIHCAMGADRTGTLVCILEALLGVSQSDLDKDYELTSFYHAYRARNGNYQGGTADWAHLMAQIEALNGSTIRDKVVGFVIGLGFTAADINTFRHDMIDGNPGDITVPTYSVTNALTHCSTSNSATSVEHGSSYSAAITAAQGYMLTGATVSITMGGSDITATSYSNGTISIPSVTGNLVITIAAAAQATTYSVTNTLTGCSNSNGAISVLENASYSAVITANSGYTLTGATVQITMGGVDITSSAYSNGAISIATVTGNVVISVVAKKENLFDEDDFVDGARLKSNGTTASYSTGQLVTGFVPAAVGNAFEINTDTSLLANAYTGMVSCYNANQEHLGQIGQGASTVWSFSDNNLKGVCTIPSSWSGNSLASTAYVRFCIPYEHLASIKIYK